MRKVMMLTAVMVCVLALGACSGDEVDPVAQEAERARVFAEEFKPLNTKYQDLMTEASEAAKKVIPLKGQLGNAKKSGNENLAAELQTKLDAATGTWDSLNAEVMQLATQVEAMKDKLRKLGHKFPGER